MIACSSCGIAARNTAKFCQNCGASLTATGNLTGMLAGKYVIVKTLGQGGMGAVYSAIDTALNRTVAIKEMSQSTLTGNDYHKAVHAFKQEAQMLAELRHPMLPTIHEHFMENGRWYLVMEYIEGVTLEDMIQGADINYILRYGNDLCTVLSFLHSHIPPIVFRDLKPANIMITPNNEIRLIDFGIARLFAGNTKDTTALGSPGYAAPELYRKESAPKSDVYALGALFHFMLTGDDPSLTPFQFTSLTQATHPSLKKLEKLVEKTLKLNKDERPDIFAVSQQLHAILKEYHANPTAVLTKADATVLLVSSFIDGKNKEDFSLVHNLQQALIAYGNTLQKTIDCIIETPSVHEADQAMQKADLILVLCTPALLNSVYGSDLVSTVVDYRIRSGTIVVPIKGKKCDWKDRYIYLAAYASTPRRNDTLSGSNHHAALNEVVNDIALVLKLDISRTRNVMQPKFPGKP